MRYLVTKAMADRAGVLPVALDRLRSNLPVLSRKAVERAILNGPPPAGQEPLVALLPGGDPIIVSGHAALAAAWCRGEETAPCRVLALPRPDPGAGRGPFAWVPVEDAGGCGLAALSTVTGQPYAAVKSFYGPTSADRGLTTADLDAYLAAHGLAADRRRVGEGWQPWPPAPWGNVHVCLVAARQDPRVRHWVTMLADGTVLDSADDRPAVRRLADYEKVYSVAAVAPAAR